MIFKTHDLFIVILAGRTYAGPILFSFFEMVKIVILLSYLVFLFKKRLVPFTEFESV